MCHLPVMWFSYDLPWVKNAGFASGNIIALLLHRRYATDVLAVSDGHKGGGNPAFLLDGFHSL